MVQARLAAARRGSMVVCSFASSLMALAPQGPAWTTLPASTPDYFFGAMAYDPVRSRAVRFGGFTDQPGGSSSVVHELLDDVWLVRQVVGPSARQHHAMVYSTRSFRTVLFGGFDGSLLGDTWEYDGQVWQRMQVAGPPARHRHAMSFDYVRRRCVMFGGFGSQLLGDTWEYDGNQWQMLANSGPAPRVIHAMAFNGRTRTTMMFGGCDQVMLGDTWIWDGREWVQQQGLGPAPRGYHAMAYDQQNERVVMYGGYGNEPLADTWEWTGAHWREVDAGQRPGRYGHAMAYDSHRRKLLLNGGITADPAATMRRSSHWSGAGIAYGQGCGNPQVTLAQKIGSEPRLGYIATAEVFQAAPPDVFLLMGFSRQSYDQLSLPLPLGAYGMDGCELLQSADTGLLPLAATGQMSAGFSVRIPPEPHLAGERIYLQAVARQSGANELDLVFSNGLEWTIGNM